MFKANSQCLRAQVQKAGEDTFGSRIMQIHVLQLAYLSDVIFYYYLNSIG